MSKRRKTSRDNDYVANDDAEQSAGENSDAEDGEDGVEQNDALVHKKPHKNQSLQQKQQKSSKSITESGIIQYVKLVRLAIILKYICVINIGSFLLISKILCVMPALSLSWVII